MSCPPVKEASACSASDQSAAALAEPAEDGVKDGVEDGVEDAAADTGAYETWLCRAARVGDPYPGTTLPVPGQVIAGKYRIETELGRGGMGAVFRARHLATERLVALKWTLRPATVRHTGHRHFREARAVGRVSHPNVVDVYDAGQEDDAGYLVMELLRGETLRARLDRGAIGAQAAVELLVPAMRGVAAANRIGIIHRDIKPDNLFIAKAADGTETIKVLDFGVSAIGGASADGAARSQAQGGAHAEAALESRTTTLTRQGSVVGTPAYMSPEQVDNPASCDARTDVYAFGIVLYECIAGRRPLEGSQRAGDGTSSHPAPAMDTPAPPSLGACRSVGAGALEPVLATALSVDRAGRFSDLDALAEALSELELRPTGVPAGSIRHGFDRVSQRSRPLSLTVRSALAAVALVGLAVWASWAAIKAETPGDETPSVAEIATDPDALLARQRIPGAAANDPHATGEHREASGRAVAGEPAGVGERQLATRAPNPGRPQGKVADDAKSRHAGAKKPAASQATSAAAVPRAGAIHLEEL